MKYSTLKRNMVLLLLVGILLAFSLFSFGTYFTPYISFLYSLFGFIFLLAIIFYPIALVYGWSQIKDVFQMISRGLKTPFHVKGKSALNGIKVVLNYIIAFLVTIIFGWAYGLYFAWQKLQYTKRFSN